MLADSEDLVQTQAVAADRQWLQTYLDLVTELDLLIRKALEEDKWMDLKSWEIPERQIGGAERWREIEERWRDVEERWREMVEMWIYEENMAEENMAEDNMAEDNMAKENMAKENMAGENMAKDNMAEENMAEENMTEEREALNHAPSQPLVNLLSPTTPETAALEQRDICGCATALGTLSVSFQGSRIERGVGEEIEREDVRK